MTLLGSVLQVFDRSGRKEPQVLNGTQSLVVLKKAEDLLDEALKLLNGIKDDLGNRQVKIYRSKYNQLYLMIVDAKSDAREREDKTTFFTGKEEKEKFHSEAQLLLRYCQAYHTDVVGASRKVYAQSSAELGLDPLQLSTDASSSSIASAIATGSLDSLPSMFNKDSQALCLSLFYTPPSGQPIFGAVSDSSKATGEGSATQRGSYSRMLTCSGGTRSAVLLQPNYRPDEDDAERSSKELIEFADFAMQCDIDSLEDYKLVEQSEAMSWISSIFSSFSLSLATPNITSGMV